MRALLIATVTLLLVAVICVQATNGEQHRAEGFKRSRRRPYVACAQGSCEYCRSGTYGGITNSGGNYCCPTTNTDSGWFPHADSAASFWHTRDYCTGLPVGQPCVTDAMCGDGSPGSCSGDLGWTSGVCVDAALEARCTSGHSACVAKCESAVNVNGNTYQLAEADSLYAICLAQCDTAVTACRQSDRVDDQKIFL